MKQLGMLIAPISNTWNHLPIWRFLIGSWICFSSETNLTSLLRSSIETWEFSVIANTFYELEQILITGSSLVLWQSLGLNRLSGMIRIWIMRNNFFRLIGLKCRFHYGCQWRMKDCGKLWFFLFPKSLYLKRNLSFVALLSN